MTPPTCLRLRPPISRLVHGGLWAARLPNDDVIIAAMSAKSAFDALA